MLLLLRIARTTPQAVVGERSRGLGADASSVAEVRPRAGWDARYHRALGASGRYPAGCAAPGLCEAPGYSRARHSSSAREGEGMTSGR